MYKVFVTYRLKPGVTIDQYAAWSKEMDQPLSSRQKGVIRFEVYAIESTEEDTSSPQIVEDIWVESYDAWKSAIQSAEMVEGSKMAFQLIDQSTLTMLYGSRVGAESDHRV